MSEVVLILGMAKHIPDSLKSMDMIGVDHGALLCVQNHVKMVGAIGDFDSVSKQEYEWISSESEVVRLPEKKNETDTEAAISYALEKGYKTIYVYGGFGGRMDHEIANLSLLIHRDLPLILMDDQNRIRVLHQGTYKIKKEYTYLSFIPLKESVISEQGVAYPLEKRKLYKRDIYAISNEIVEDYADIMIHEGSVLMIEAKD